MMWYGMVCYDTDGIVCYGIYGMVLCGMVC